MSVLVFPDSPLDGQLYPPTPIPGVNQYKWSAAANTWEIVSIEDQFIQRSIIETKGDLIVGESNDTPQRLPVGDDGDVLVADSAEFLGVKWETPTSSIPDSIIDNKGDLIVGEEDDTPAVLPVGNDGDVLVADSAETLGIKWEAPIPSIPNSIIDNKGDLIVGEEDDTPAVLPVGNDGDILIADSGEPLGIKWEPFTGSGIPESIIEAKGDLIVGQAPSDPEVLSVDTNDGYVLTVDSNETLGVKWAPPSGSSPSIDTLSYTTATLNPGETFEFWLDFGKLFTWISIEVTGVAKDLWIRAYTSEAGRAADARIAPGPPFPSPNSGFAAEILTNPTESDITFLPTLAIYAEDGMFLKVTNQSGASNHFSIDFRTIETLPDDCDTPPYYCNTYVNTACVTDFSSAPDGSLYGDAPGLVYSGGTTILAEANNSYNEYVSGGDGTLGEFFLNRGSAGEITDFSIYSGSGYKEGNTVIILGSKIGGVDGTDNVTITLSATNGMKLSGAWEGCTTITNFPKLNFNNGVNFTGAWKDCTYLQFFPADVFDNCEAILFEDAWLNCALSQESVDNVLISLDAAGQDNGFVTLNGGTSFPPGTVGNAARLSLIERGWTVEANYAEPYCNPTYPLLPVTYPPYSCNTVVNTSGVTDFTSAWEGCYSITDFPCVDSSSVTLFTNAWANCQYMVSFPPINTSQGTDFSYSWSYCYLLNSIPSLDFQSGTNFTYSWSYCYGFTSFPWVDLSNGTNFYGTWNACYNLTLFPGLDLGSGTDFTYTWYYCDNLTSFPVIDVSSGENFYGTWNSCSNLTSFPLLDVSNGTNFNRTWAGCTNLSSFPLLDLSNGTNFEFTWANCWALTTLPFLDLSNGTNFSGTWRWCLGMISLPLLDLSSGTDFTEAWLGCSSMTSLPLFNVSNGTTFQESWNGCSSLTSFPLLNVSNSDNFQGSWSGCSSLTSFPALDIGQGIYFAYAWYNCSSLTSFPAGMFDSTTATYFYFTWKDCALDQTSVDNILVSLDTAGQLGGLVDIDGGTSSAPGTAGAAAKLSLQGKGWTVNTN